MDDLEVIRFLAMDIITSSAYHAFPSKKSPFFREGPLLIRAPHQSDRSYATKLAFTMTSACREWSSAMSVAGSTIRAISVRTNGSPTVNVRQLLFLPKVTLRLSPRFFRSTSSCRRKGKKKSATVWPPRIEPSDKPAMRGDAWRDRPAGPPLCSC